MLRRPREVHAQERVFRGLREIVSRNSRPVTPPSRMLAYPELRHLQGTAEALAELVRAGVHADDEHGADAHAPCLLEQAAHGARAAELGDGLRERLLRVAELDHRAEVDGAGEEEGVREFARGGGAAVGEEQADEGAGDGGEGVGVEDGGGERVGAL